jgi:heavy metal sensor kinase
MGPDMYLKKILRLPGTLAFRLTLWYAGIFTISALVSFAALYLVMSSVIQEHGDKDLLDDMEEFSTILATQGLDQVKTEMAWEASSDGAGNIFLRLLSKDGRELDSTDMSLWRGIGPSTHALENLRTGASHVFETLTLPQHEHQVRMVYGMIGPDTILQIGESLEEDEKFLAIFREVFLPIMTIMTLAAAVMGWFIARRAIAGVEEVTQTAIEISKGALDRRVPVKVRGDEIERLATMFNDMLDRISALIREMREMSDNIAHDLRSPLARIRGAAEMALTTSSSVDEHKAIAAGMIEECDHLLGMINTMLDIAEAESGAGKLVLEEVDIADMIRRACELFRPIAENNSITMTTELPDRCVVRGEPRKLQRMIANLLDNALKYTPSEGIVKVSLTVNNGQIAISISDTGIGISEEDLPHIFKRFYTCNKSQPPHGTGLGLSLVRAIARSHGGHVNVTSHPGKGSTFTVTLPRRPLSH